MINQTAWPCNNCRSIERAKSELKGSSGMTIQGRDNQPDESRACGSGDASNGLAHAICATQRLLIRRGELDEHHVQARCISANIQITARNIGAYEYIIQAILVSITTVPIPNQRILSPTGVNRSTPSSPTDWTNRRAMTLRMGKKRYAAGQKYMRVQYILRVPYRRWIGGKPKGNIMAEKIPPIASA
jgi:hypothetical protein